MRQFEHAAWEDFAGRLAAHLRQHHADRLAGLSDAQLRGFVRHAIVRARHYGLTWESSIAAYVRMTIAVSSAFDNHPAVRAILTDPVTPPNRRIDHLLREISAEHWAEAARLTSGTRR